MSTPPDPYERLAAALDRFQEAHFWIHAMEQSYHSADHFRWHLNVFLKALKEVPSLIQMALQNDPGFVTWFDTHATGIKADPLLAKLAKQRDFVVHRGALQLASKGELGITEFRGMKLGLSYPVRPWEDSDEAMERFLDIVASKGDAFGFLNDDEDSLPCIHREWRLPDFDDEVVDLCAKAWLRLGETVAEVLRWLGTEPPALSLDCRHSNQRVRFKTYDRSRLRARVTELKKVAAAALS